MNDLDLCLEVVSRSRQPLRYIWRWLHVSRKPLEIEASFQRTTNRKWHMGYQTVTRPMTSRDPRRFCEAIRSAIIATAWLLVTCSSSNGHSQQRATQVYRYAPHGQGALPCLLCRMRSALVLTPSRWLRALHNLSPHLCTLTTVEWFTAPDRLPAALNIIVIDGMSDQSNKLQPQHNCDKTNCKFSV